MVFDTVRDALLDRGFAVSAFPSAVEAADYLDQKIDGKDVSLGGSMTLSQMNLPKRLAAHNKIYLPSAMFDGLECEVDAARAMASEVYLSSVNALAETGEMVSIDGIGNRVASMLYGHQKVYLVVGRNKLAPDYDGAVWRARNVAAPGNAARLQRKTPCAASGHCHDCHSPERICRGMVVLWENMYFSEIEVVLVDEELGL